MQDWKDYRRAVIAPMEKEQALLSLMFVLVGITTVFIVFVVFHMIVMHKTKDIGVLKSVGASNSDVLALFSGFAFGIGLIGSSAGILAGWLFLAKINRIEQWLFEHFRMAVMGPHDLRDRRHPESDRARSGGDHHRQRDCLVPDRGPGAQLPCGPAAAGGNAPCPAE